MDIAVVAPQPVPPKTGGAERLWNGLVRAIGALTPHRAELVTLPTPERTFAEVQASYEAWSQLDLSRFDMVISTKYPAWMVQHPNHHVYMQHPLRGLYDLYPPGLTDEAAFPGPQARAFVQHLDRVALSVGRVRRHLAISATVAARGGYFPVDASVEVVHHPSDLTGLHDAGSDWFFTASRMEPLKRVDLIVRAFRRVRGDVRLRIAGAGPDLDRVRELAAGDSRIEILGAVDEDTLVSLYAGALAVPFVPFDEDFGLITLEAMGSGKPVITTTDSGGPTELVAHGVNGFVVAPDEVSLADALGRFAGDVPLARRMGSAARATAARVTWERTLEALLRERPGRRRVGARRVPGKPRVVVVSTFPVHPRRGGGQLRSWYLYGALAERYDVELVSLTGPGDLPMEIELRPGVVERVVPKSAEHEAAEQRLLAEVGVPVTDIAASLFIERTPDYLGALREAAAGATCIVLAHPYLVTAVEQAAPSVPFVYDAHNVEAALKEWCVEEVREVERRATVGARVVAACSEADARLLVELYGVEPGRVTVVENGVDAGGIGFVGGALRRRRRERWLAAYGADGFRHVALFAGSLHPPNVDAVERIFALSGAAPDTLFVVAGGVDQAFRRRQVPSNVVLLGQVSDAEKEVLLGTADVALNPMTRGSGTNLKVVEYMAAGAPVVSTPLGVRGLAVEDGVHVAVAEADAFVERMHVEDEMAMAARRLVDQRYDWAVIAPRFERVVARAS